MTTNDTTERALERRIVGLLTSAPDDSSNRAATGRATEAIIGDAVARVVAYAREAGKPVVMERLDFRQKKAVLEGQACKYNRMLSSFSYGKIKACFLSRGYRQGVD